MTAVTVTFAKQDGSAIDGKFTPRGGFSWLCEPEAVPLVGDRIECDRPRTILSRTWIAPSVCRLNLQIGSAEA